MSDSTIEKAMPRVAVTRLARKALIELNLSADAVNAVRNHVNNTLSDIVSKLIVLAQHQKAKTVSTKEVLHVVPNPNELKAQEGVKVATCPKVSFSVKKCGEDAKTGCRAEARLSKIHKEVKFYSEQGLCHILPKRSFSSLVKAAVEKHSDGKKISSDAVSLLQSFTEIVIQKTLNAAGQIAAVNNKSTIKGEHVDAALKVMKMGC